MEEKELVKFDLMRRDNIIAKVELNMARKEANVDLVDGQDGHLYLGKDDSFADIMEFLQSRSIVRRKGDSGLLSSIGLNSRSSLFDILEKTNGVKDGDNIWINFSHQKISYPQVVEWIKSLTTSKDNL
ncbi:hypothetical protein [Paenibacillus planticolens]|uniref:Uncharacterized protein n=1 Tax=Paenibacillus planticolens TaxID=2654976 RepID=A0ABX1ZHE3_9BACL|nr:hypothetical protein [Paenibacillus planticolens]NOU99499.1 hypothetical protein [Paenibacillus planticolens]